MSTRDFYTDLAAVYDQRDHTDVALAFERELRPLLADRPQGTWALDLACGTGVLAARIAAAGCPVLGVDSAQPMLRIARRRCEALGDRTRFQLGDLRTFRARVPCGVASASGDIINHLPSLRVVRAVFANVHDQIVPGGVLVFDSLKRFCFEQYWKERTYHMEGDAGDLVMECDWDSTREVGTARMIGYVKKGKGSYTKVETELIEHLYSRGEIRDALRSAGFASIRRKEWSPWDDQHLEPAMDRDLWTATKQLKS